MLKSLQSHIETEEARWESQLRAKEGEISNLRIELKELANKSTVNEKVSLVTYRRSQ